jgi:hypothetical protein
MAGAVVLFERFVTAFATFNAENVADLFELPAPALRKDGLLVSLPTRGDVVRYYQAARDGYYRDGCRSCG